MHFLFIRYGTLQCFVDGLVFYILGVILHLAKASMVDREQNVSLLCLIQILKARTAAVNKQDGDNEADNDDDDDMIIW